MTAAEFLGLGNRLTNPSNTTLTMYVGGNGVADNSNCNGIGIGNVTSISTHVGGVCGNAGMHTTKLDALNTANNTNPNTLVGAYMPLTPSPTQSSISPGTSNSNAFDMFQVIGGKKHALTYKYFFLSTYLVYILQ